MRTQINLVYVFLSKVGLKMCSKACIRYAYRRKGLFKIAQFLRIRSLISNSPGPNGPASGPALPVVGPTSNLGLLGGLSKLHIALSSHYYCYDKVQIAFFIS